MTQDTGRAHPASQDRAATPSEPSQSSVVSGVAGIPCAFTVAEVLAWARTKPADEAYDYCGFETPCAVAQFLMETGRSSDPQVSGNLYAEGAPWNDNDGKRHFIPSVIAAAAHGVFRQTTFGTFAKRLAQIDAEQVSA